jgi:hypothetical protein
MMGRMKSVSKLALLFSALVVLLSPGSRNCFAGKPDEELQLQAQLVWGTNEEKNPEQAFKDVEPRLRKNLQGVFKWNHYYEISRTNFSVALNKPKAIPISRKCKIEVKHYGQSNLDVKLYGEGKFVLRKKQTLTPAGRLVLAGDDKDGTAWFVVLTTPHPVAKTQPKAGPPKQATEAAPKQGARSASNTPPRTAP